MKLRRHLLWLALSTTLAFHGCGGSGNGGFAPLPLPPASAPPPAPAPAPAADPGRADTSEGVVVGKIDEGVYEFFGIPYAQAPIGPLRWAPPQPPAARSAPLQATAFGKACPQSAWFGPAPPSSEDCLFLNVWKPADAKAGAKLPVLVYIHGGAFVGGSGEQDFAPLARRGVVVVSLNYRLGALGYLANRALRTANKDGSLGNFALMDMLAALGWVQRNIGAFGGDAGNVTLWGTSAGATQSFSLLQSPKAKGLFQRAMMQSGGAAEYSNPSMDSSLTVGDAAVTTLGCASASDQVACLRAQPVSALLALNGSKWRPTVDAHILTEVPARSFESGNFNQVPVMIGGVYDEGTQFVDPKLSASAYLPSLHSLAPSGFDTSTIDAAYPMSNFVVPAQGMARAIGDAMYGCGNSAWRSSLSAWVPVYGWEFTDPALSFPVNPTAFYYGSAHTIDSYYFTDRVDALPTYPYLDKNVLQNADETAKRKALGDQMTTYLANFIHTGDPNGDGRNVALRWPPHIAPSKRSLMAFTLPASRISVNEFEQVHRCDGLWAALY